MCKYGLIQHLRSFIFSTYYDKCIAIIILFENHEDIWIVVKSGIGLKGKFRELNCISIYSLYLLVPPLKDLELCIQRSITGICMCKVENVYFKKL